jgi:hypothetical protein
VHCELDDQAAMHAMDFLFWEISPEEDQNAMSARCEHGVHAFWEHRVHSRCASSPPRRSAHLVARRPFSRRCNLPSDAVRSNSSHLPPHSSTTEGGYDACKVGFFVRVSARCGCGACSVSCLGALPSCRSSDPPDLTSILR